MIELQLYDLNCTVPDSVAKQGMEVGRGYFQETVRTKHTKQSVTTKVLVVRSVIRAVLKLGVAKRRSKLPVTRSCLESVPEADSVAFCRTR